MALISLPLPRFNYKSANDEALAAHMGARLVDTYIDELGTFNKRPGLSVYCDLGTNSSVDGLFWSDEFNKIMAVSGGNIFTIEGGSQVGTPTDVTGDTLESAAKVSFVEDGTYVFMANGGEIVTYDNANPTDKMSDIETGPGTAPTSVSAIAFMDSYLIAQQAATATFFYTDPTDRLSWTDTDFYNTDYAPDVSNNLMVQDREITIFADTSIETWWNDGSAPFSRIQSALYDIGVKAPGSVVAYRGGYLFLDSNYRISALGGRQIQQISAPVDTELRDLIDAGDGRAFIAPIGNRVFYVLTFNADNKSIAYDLTTNGWAEWGEWDSTNHEWDRFKAWSYTFARDYNIHLVGGFGDGKIYKLDFDVFQDDGQEIRSVIKTAPQTHGTFNRKRSNSIRLRLKRGQTSGAEARIRWMDDDSNTATGWSAERNINLGDTGEGYMFVKLNNMGTYRARQYEFIHTDNSPFNLVKIEEDVEGGIH